MADCAACGLPLDPAARHCRHCGAGVTEAGGLSSYAVPTAADSAQRPAAPDPDGGPRREFDGGPRPEFDGGPRAGLDGGPRRRTLLVLVTVLVVAAAATVALAAARRSTAPTAVPGPAAPLGNTVSASATGTTAGTRTGTPGPTPAGVTVQLADSLRSAPYAPNVVALFRRYFDSINNRDYETWLGTLSRDRKPDPREKFLDEYSTTADDEVKIVGITARDDGTLLVAVSFRSRQDPRYAPVDQPVDCLRWQVLYPLKFEDGQLKIALVEFVNRSYRPCADG